VPLNLFFIYYVYFETNSLQGAFNSIKIISFKYVLQGFLIFVPNLDKKLKVLKFENVPFGVIACFNEMIANI